MGCASPGLSLYSRDASSLSFDQMMSGVSSCPSTDREQSCLQTQAKSGRNDWGGGYTRHPSLHCQRPRRSPIWAGGQHQTPARNPLHKRSPPQQQQQPGPRQGRPRSSHAPLQAVIHHTRRSSPVNKKVLIQTTAQLLKGAPLMHSNEMINSPGHTDESAPQRRTPALPGPCAPAGSPPKDTRRKASGRRPERGSVPGARHPSQPHLRQDREAVKATAFLLVGILAQN